MNKLSYIYCPHCAKKLQGKLIEDEYVQDCSSCGFIYWNNPKPVTSILLHTDDTVLLLKRSSEPFKDFWVFPGGFMGSDETPQEAVCRETKEEIGLRPKLGRVIGTYRIDDDPRGIHIDIVYEGTFSGIVTLSDEHTTFSFFPFENLPDTIAYKHREAIMDWKKLKNKEKA